MEKLPKNVEVFASSRCIVGEGPIWVADEKTFYWLDLLQGHIYRNKENAGASEFEMFKLDVGKIGGMVRCKSGKFLLFCEKACVYLWAPKQTLQKIAEIKEAQDSRFNDITPSLDGGVFCTIAPTDSKKGQLWHFSTDKKFTLIDDSLDGMPNGMGFSPDQKTFYLTVSN